MYPSGFDDWLDRLSGGEEMVTALAIMAVPAVLWILLLMRLSRYRKDAPGHRATSSLFDTVLLPQDLLSKELYTEKGQKLLPWLWLTLWLGAVAFFAAFVLLAEGL